MKNLYLTGLLAASIFFFQSTAAQEPIAVKQQLLQKSLAFSQLPEKFACNLAELQRVFYGKKEDTVTLRLSDKFVFIGQVSEKVQRTAGLLSINVRSENYPGALLTISYSSRPGASPKITGTIINPQSGDAFILIEEHNKYFLLKKSQQFFMTE